MTLGIKAGIVMLSVIMLNVVMLSVITLSDVAPQLVFFYWQITVVNYGKKGFTR